MHYRALRYPMILAAILAFGAVAAASTLTVNFTGMTPHLGQDFWLRVVDKGTGGEVARTHTQITAADFSLMLDGLTPLRSYWVDFFADFNGNGQYDPPPADHAWRLEANSISGDTTLDFAHNLNFTDILWPYLLTVNFTGMTPHVGRRFELRLVDQLTRLEVGRTGLAAIPGPAFAIEIPGLRAGGQYQLGFYVDDNGNGLYDPPPTDPAWRVAFTAGPGDTTVDFDHTNDFTDIQWPYRLTVNFLSFGPHLGETFQLRVVEQATGREVGRTRLDAIPVADFSVFVPGLQPGVDYRVDFYADFNGNGVYDPPPADHAWRTTFTDTSGDVSMNYTHNVNFTDIEWPPPYFIYFPRLSFIRNAQTEGFGFVNTTDTDVLVRFYAFDSAGDPLPPSPDYSWPASGQEAFQAEGLFGLKQDTDAWAVAECTGDSLRGFFLSQRFSAGQLVGLDGAEVFTATLSDGILSRVKTSGTFATELFLANPGTSTVQVSLTGYDGAQVLAGGIVDIPVLGFRKIDLAAIFGAGFDGYVRVQATGGIIGSAVIRDGETSIASLNLQPVSAAAATTYAPHVVLFPNLYYTEVNLINPSGSSVTVTLAPYDAAGNPLAAPFDVDIPANQLITLRDGDLGLPGGLQTEGWLKVTGTAPILGCLTFGDPMDNRYMSTLPLQSEAADRLYFAQVANGDVGGVSFFTGLAVVNPGDTSTLVTIQIFGSDGSLYGTATRSLGPREKYVRLIQQIEGIGPLPDQSSGYIIVTASQPVFSFVLFGNDALDFLSAVPAQH
jgi:hypothetical protein